MQVEDLNAGNNAVVVVGAVLNAAYVYLRREGVQGYVYLSIASVAEVVDGGHPYHVLTLHQLHLGAEAAVLQRNNRSFAVYGNGDILYQGDQVVQNTS